MQFFADNTKVEWSALGYSDGNCILSTSHCRFAEYGGTDLIKGEFSSLASIDQNIQEERMPLTNGWSTHAFSFKRSIVSFDHIHPLGGKKPPSDSDKELLSLLRSKNPNVSASIFLPNEMPFSY